MSDINDDPGTSSASSSPLTDIVNALFDSSFVTEEPPGLAKADPVDFLREIIAQKKARGWQAAIVLSADYDVDTSRKVLKLIDKGRELVSGKEFDEAWRAIQMSMDISVMGSDAWCPRVLPNGGVAWRNHHRVIGFDEGLAGSIAVASTALRAELQSLRDHLSEDGEVDLGDEFGFSVLYHAADGVHWTRQVPEALSTVGQTLVILPRDWIAAARAGDAWPTLASDMIDEAAASSRSGHVALRVFGDRVFVYSTYRAGDEFDTILEEHAHSMGGGEPDDEPYPMRFTQDYSRLAVDIGERLREREPDVFKSLWGVGKVTRLLAEDALFTDYAKRKSGQITEWQPVFGPDWEQPASYVYDYDPFWQQCCEAGGGLVVLDVGVGLAKKLKGLGARLYKVFDKIVPAKLRGEGTRLHIPREDGSDLRWIDDEDLFAYGSPEAQARFDALEAEWSAAFKVEKKENGTTEDDFISELNRNVRLLVRTDNTDPVFWNALARKGSAKVDGGVGLHMPQYGLTQNYDSGDFDSGNASKFISSDDDD